MNKFLVLVLLVSASFPSHAEWRERRAALSEMHRVGEFRIFYSRSGTDALPNMEDKDRDGAPDYVERIADKLVAARELYENQARLRSPLTSPRYQNRAAFIDVNLLSFPLAPNSRNRGIAYDGLSSFARRQDAGSKVRVLVMDIANDLPTNTATPAHELFHLFQNGYTLFKNRWYTEGTARWAEDPDRFDKTVRWPNSSAEIRDMFKQTYETASFWRRLAVKMDPASGHAFVRAFLEELDHMDNAVSASDGRPAGEWREADQFSSANDTHIWRALRNTLNRPAFLPRWDDEVHSLMAIEL